MGNILTELWNPSNMRIAFWRRNREADRIVMFSAMVACVGVSVFPEQLLLFMSLVSKLMDIEPRSYEH